MNTQISLSGRRVLVLMVILQAAITILVTLHFYNGLGVIVNAEGPLTSYHLLYARLQDLSFAWVFAALLFMVVIASAIHAGKQWAAPFILLLLIGAGLHLIWRSMPWAWVYQDSLLRAITVAQAVVLLTFFVILAFCQNFVQLGNLQLGNLHLLRVGSAVALALVIVFAKGTLSFCCPQYGPEPPMWWVYLHISDLWDPREKAFLMMWACYAGLLGLNSLVNTFGIRHRRKTVDL